MRLSSRRAAGQHAFGPLAGNRVPALHSAKKRVTDGGVGVGISAADDVHQGFPPDSGHVGAAIGRCGRLQGIQPDLFAWLVIFP